MSQLGCEGRGTIRRLRSKDTKVNLARDQGFRFVQSVQLVRRFSEVVDLSNSLLDGFGEPSYKLCSLNKAKALEARTGIRGGCNEIGKRDAVAYSVAFS